ncbi:MAG: hypothetical protein KY475_11235 [Planctomycetes bacterium]|nr:hypothetical protein [Planctomycetota bacterium]
MSDDQLCALDDGDEIVITLADRSCRVRLAETQEAEEASQSRDLALAGL